MSSDIVIEALRLIEKIKVQYPTFVGRTATEQEIVDLELALKIKLPDWYRDLYLNVPIIDAEFGLQEYQVEDDFDGVSYMIWGDIGTVIQESMEYVPGIHVREKGYLFVASCSHGSGDPIFINLNTSDHSVFRIYHDDTSVVQIADCLSNLFKNVII